MTPDNHIARKARILVFIPMYNCASQIGRVIAQFSEPVQQCFSKIVIIDNRSTDQGLEITRQAITGLRCINVALLQNIENYGLGGSHKVAFDHALVHGFDYVAILHGDDQGSIADLLPHLDQLDDKQVDCLLGARFMPGSRLQGYSRFRTFGNLVFNRLYSLAAGQRLYDLGSGLNLYAVTALQDRGWLTFPDDLTFNYYMILASAAKKWRMRFFPLTWREEDQRSNVKMLRQAWKVLAIAMSYVTRRQAFLTADWRAQPRRSYRAETIVEHIAMPSGEMGVVR
jgi:glycosyltransferase involved in cell wall biosynthesis